MSTPAARLSRRTMLFGLALAAISSAAMSCAGRAAPAPISGQGAGPAVAVQPPANPAGLAGTAPSNGARAAPPQPISNAASDATTGSTVVDHVAPTATAVPAPAAPAPATIAVVQMTDQDKFVPSTFTISRGTTVEWKDASAQPHNITCDPAKAMKKSDVAYPSGAQPVDSGFIMGGQSFKHTFTVAGEYRYICIPHEMMGVIGTIIVT